jgi:hypothetical protein
MNMDEYTYTVCIAIARQRLARKSHALAWIEAESVCAALKIVLEM